FEWIDDISNIIKLITFKPNRPDKILLNFLKDIKLEYVTDLGREFISNFKNNEMAIYGLFTTYTILCPHINKEFQEAAAILITRLMIAGKKRDSNNHITDLSVEFPNYLINKAFQKIISLNSLSY